MDPPHDFNQFSYTYDELSNGLAFQSFVEATEYMKKWCDSHKSPFIKRDSCKGSATKAGRIMYQCPHGTKRKYKETLVRERQSVNYTACEARVHVHESVKDRIYRVTSCVKVHSGHMVGEDVYGSYPTVRVMSEATKKKVIELENVGASRRRVAATIGDMTGMLYSSKDIYNNIMSCKKKVGDGGVLEKYLTDIQLEGGKVYWKKSDEGEVMVLWIQTKSMVIDVEKTKPFVWQTDTTFGTNREGYKVYVPLHRSCTTGRYEVSGFLFIAAENRECVESGLRFFKSSLNYSPADIGQKFIFFVDKDFSYIEVIRDVFPDSRVLLDDVHVDRYFREKVFPGAYRADREDEVDKQELVQAVTQCRVAHTVDQYIDKRVGLMELGVGLYVKPGRTKKAVLFNDYFMDNWEDEAPMWVYAYRKQLPLQGSGSTQACEAFFRVLKQFEKQEFGQRSPSLNEMIPAISRAIDRRFLLRSLTTAHKRIKYYNSDPRCQIALDKASWDLNPIGLQILNDNFKLCFKKWENMELGQDGVITEKFESLNQTKEYNTDGCICDCSYFKQMFYCRHITFYRLKTNMPLFELDAFHQTLTKNSTNTLNLNFCEDSSHENTSPPSPGISMARLEGKRSKKTASQSQKFNMAFDIGRELAEVTSSFDTETFNSILEMNKNYLKQVRKGLSIQLCDYLKCPEKFLIIPASTNIPVAEMSYDQAAHSVSVGRDQPYAGEPDQGEERNIDLQGASLREDQGDTAQYVVAESNIIEHGIASASTKANYNATVSAHSLPCMQSGHPEATVVGVEERGSKSQEAMSNGEIPSLPTSGGFGSQPALDLQAHADLVDDLLYGLVCANLPCQANLLFCTQSRCQNCQSMIYCGIECQLRGWRIHEKVCKKMKYAPFDQRKALIQMMIVTFDGDLNGNIVTSGSVEATDRISATSPRQPLDAGGSPASLSNATNYQSSPQDCEQLRGERSNIVDRPYEGQPSSPPGNNSSAFTFEEEELPELQYTSSQSVSEIELPIRFQTAHKSKGRPQVKRQPDRKKTKIKSMPSQFYEKFPMKETTEEKTKRQRKTRSDKGKKRGSRLRSKEDKLEVDDEEENNTNNSSIVDAIQPRKPRAPRNHKTLSQQYSKPFRPDKCITCHFPLEYDKLIKGEKVVNCEKCKSFIHQSCVKNCGFCEEEDH